MNKSPQKAIVFEIPHFEVEQSTSFKKKISLICLFYKMDGCIKNVYYCKNSLFCFVFGSSPKQNILDSTKGTAMTRRFTKEMMKPAMYSKPAASQEVQDLIHL